MTKGDDLEDRLIDYAVRIIKVSESLPNTPAGKHIRGQLLRSGTSPAPNYGEARSAESNRDFIHKLKIALKELNETRIWLKMIIRSDLVSEHLLASVLDECEQLCRILSRSIQTSRHKNH
ncbi:MAG: four helix bundle protein, partial [Chloroflexota bacterium]